VVPGKGKKKEKKKNTEKKKKSLSHRSTQCHISIGTAPGWTPMGKVGRRSSGWSVAMVGA